MMEPERETERPSQRELDERALRTGRTEDKTFRVIHNSGLYTGYDFGCPRIRLHLQVEDTQLTIVARAGHNMARAVSRLGLESGHVITGLRGLFHQSWGVPPGFTEYALLVSAVKDVCKTNDPDTFMPHSVPGGYSNLADIRELPGDSWVNLRRFTLVKDNGQQTGDTDFPYRNVLKDESFPDGVPVVFLSSKAKVLQKLMSGKQSLDVTLHYAEWRSYRGMGPCVLVTEDTHVFFRKQKH